MRSTHHHTVSMQRPQTFMRADRLLLASTCAAVCGWAVTLAWLWMA